MKTMFLAAVFSLGLAGLGAQEPPAPQASLKSAHYELLGMDRAAEEGLKVLERELELRFELYNRLFRFDTQALKPLRVRVFTGQAAYDSYVSGKLGSPRPGAVYLHYTSPEKRELCVLQGGAETASVLPHQAFIQYLRALIPNPPSWMQEGFAIFFSTVGFDPLAEARSPRSLAVFGDPPMEETAEKTPGALSYEENLAWLEYLKNLGDKAPSPRSVLEADMGPEGALSGGALSGDQPSRTAFQAASWGLVSFFLGSGNSDYYRTLTECFMSLSPTARAADNSRAVLKRITLWTSFDVLERDYQAYIRGRKSFTELLNEGVRAYSDGDALNAELAFRGALNLRPSHYGPSYYLGLLAYEAGNYASAEEYYRSSLAKGADEALVFFALGINAVAAGRNQDARDWLKKAAAADPRRYQSRSDDITRRLR